MAAGFLRERGFRLKRPPKRDGDAKQKTPKGLEIPIPTRKDVEDLMRGVTGKRPSGSEGPKKK